MKQGSVVRRLVRRRNPHGSSARHRLPKRIGHEPGGRWNETTGFSAQFGGRSEIAESVNGKATDSALAAVTGGKHERYGPEPGREGMSEASIVDVEPRSSQKLDVRSEPAEGRPVNEFSHARGGSPRLANQRRDRIPFAHDDDVARLRPSPLKEGVQRWTE